jgi:hypothetical protein
VACGTLHEELLVRGLRRAHLCICLLIEHGVVEDAEVLHRSFLCGRAPTMLGPRCCR